MAVVVAAALPLAFASHAGAADADAEWQFVAGINELRAQAGEPPLTIDAQLTGVARQWSATMAGANRLFHNMALPRWVNNWTKLGENVGWGESVDVTAAAFAASPAHLEHIVDPAYSLVGVGVVESGGRLWVTEEFERPAPATQPVVRPAVAREAVATHGQVLADTRPALVFASPARVAVAALRDMRQWATRVADVFGTKRNN